MTEGLLFWMAIIVFATGLICLIGLVRLVIEDGWKRGLTCYCVPARTLRWVQGGGFFGPIQV